MAKNFITVRSQPDALVRVYRVDDDSVVYVDNTNEDGETARIGLDDGADYFIDVTTYA